MAPSPLWRLSRRRQSFGEEALTPGREALRQQERQHREPLLSSLQLTLSGTSKRQASTLPPADQ